MIKEMFKRIVMALIGGIGWVIIVTCYMTYRDLDIEFIADHVDVIMITAFIIFLVNFIAAVFEKETTDRKAAAE